MILPRLVKFTEKVEYWLSKLGGRGTGSVCLLNRVPVWDDGKILETDNGHDNNVNGLSATIKGRPWGWGETYE